jgi:hypothetical protein
LTRNSSTSAILIPKRTFSLDYPDDWEWDVLFFHASHLHGL